MPSLQSITISGYRSIGEQVTINFPDQKPLILMGENNAGKSNILRAIDLIMGETYPKYKEPELSDFYQRDQNCPMRIHARVRDFKWGRNPAQGFIWCFDPQAQEDKLTYTLDTGVPYISNDLRRQLTSILVDADRRLSFNLGYSSKYSLLSKIMHKFHAHLTADSQRVVILQSLYDQLINVFKGVKEFAEFTSTLQTAFNETVEGMTYKLEVDFSAYDPNNFFHSLRIQAKEGEEIRTLTELGTGQEQILALALAHAYAKAFHENLILILEEPEAHLHPLAQQWMANKIYSMCCDGLQVILTTHSPAFVDLDNLENLVLVSKDDGGTCVKQVSVDEFYSHCVKHKVDTNKATQKNIKRFYKDSATPDLLAGFFAKRIVLVEGPTESLALPIYFAQLGCDIYKEGIAIIPVTGKQSLSKWWRLFTAFDIPTYIIFDNDNKDDSNGKGRREILNILNLEEKAIDELLGCTELNVWDTFTVFGTTFEKTMRAEFSSYAELEQQAQQYISGSKPLQARYIASQLTLDDYPDGKAKFKMMIDSIISLNA